MNNVVEFNRFIGEISLSKALRRRIDRRVRAVAQILGQLDSFERVQRRGSYALRTIIRPDEQQDYDVDLLVFLKDGGRNKKPAAYLDEVHSCLASDKNYADKLCRKTRCVTVQYAGDFHLDLVPCITKGGRDFICNRSENDFEETDGTGFRDWFNHRANITHGNLKPATRLLKRLRNHQGNFVIPSIALTALAGNIVSGDSDGVNFKNIPHALKTTANRINSFLEKNRGLPDLDNPALSIEKFTRDWEQRDYDNFREKFAIYTGKINAAWDETDRRQSIRKWRELFGDNFGR